MSDNGHSINQNGNVEKNPRTGEAQQTPNARLLHPAGIRVE